MTHTYTVSGMTCGNCREKVRSALIALPDVTDVKTNPTTAEVTVTMGRHIDTATLNQAVAAKGSYTLAEKHAGGHSTMTAATETEEPITLKTYWPLILVALYIVGGTVLVQLNQGWHWMGAMNAFMGLFFITFSFFKLLDLQGFAMSYSSYDIVAQRWLGYGYVYPFIELLLGIAYLTHFEPVATNAVTLVVMGVSTVGVLKGILRKSPFKCACLGTVFNLPMTTVTLVEDGLMVAMAATMLIVLLV